MTRLSGMFLIGAVVCAGFATPAISEDFNGGYVGASIGIGTDPVATNSGRDWSVSTFAGYNYRFNDVLVASGEIEADYNPESVWGYEVFTGKLRGRAGYVVSDTLMIYGRTGTGYMAGVDFGDGDGFIWDFGAGVEFEIHDHLSMRGDVGYIKPLGDGLNEQTNFRLGVLTNF